MLPLSFILSHVTICVTLRKKPTCRPTITLLILATCNLVVNACLPEYYILHRERLADKTVTTNETSDIVDPELRFALGSIDGRLRATVGLLQIIGEFPYEQQDQRQCDELIGRIGRLTAIQSLPEPNIPIAYAMYLSRERGYRTFIQELGDYTSQVSSGTLTPDEVHELYDRTERLPSTLQGRYDSLLTSFYTAIDDYFEAIEKREPVQSMGTNPQAMPSKGPTPLDMPARATNPPRKIRVPKKRKRFIGGVESSA